MTIYKLYVKTHNKTGLKYLGFTKNTDPHKYPGSGLYWTNHLNLHGRDYSTEILFESDNKSEITEKGIYYSNLWNVVTSSDWANLKPETGDGSNGYRHTDETKLLLSSQQIGKPKSKEMRDRLRVVALARPAMSIEARQKISDANRKRTHSEETKAKMSATRKGRPGRPFTEESKAKMRETKSAKRKG
jgi:hypothetical protein